MRVNSQNIIYQLYKPVLDRPINLFMHTVGEFVNVRVYVCMNDRELLFVGDGAQAARVGPDTPLWSPNRPSSPQERAGWSRPSTHAGDQENCDAWTHRKPNSCRSTQEGISTELIFARFLADRTAACSIIGYWHETVVCLSVTKCIVAKRHIYYLLSYRKSVWTRIACAPSEHNFTTWNLATPTISTKIPHNHRRRYHLANTLKHTVSKRTAKISTSGIIIVSSRVHIYSRQRRTIVFFSATAGLFVSSLQFKTLNVI